MSAVKFIRQAVTDGVSLAVSPLGGIRATGEPAALRKWTPILAANKTAILDVLHDQAADLTPEADALIRRVMALRQCPNAERLDFIDDWRLDPHGVEAAMRHLVGFYGRRACEPDGEE